MTAEEAAELKGVLSQIHPDAVVELSPGSDGVDVELASEGGIRRFKIDDVYSPLIRSLGVGVRL